MFLSRVKSLKFIGKIIVFDGLEGCMCERERYLKNIKNDIKIHPKIYEKSIQKTCSKKACRNHEKTPEMDPTRQPESIKILEKQGPKINAKKEAHRQKVGRSGAGPL